MAKKINGSRFKPQVDLGPEDLDSLVVQGFGKVSEPTLRNFGWTGGCAGTIGITLAADNKRILATDFYLCGSLHDDASATTTCKATKFWPEVPPSWELKLPFEDLSVFRFDGNLQSALVASEGLKFSVFDTESNATISMDEFKEAGGSHFTLRAFVHMTTSIWFKVQLLIMPVPKDSIIDRFACALNPAFPGLKLTFFDAPLLPNAVKKYGLAFYPLLQKGNTAANFPAMSSFNMRNSISKLLQTGKTAKCLSDQPRLLARLRNIEETGLDALSAPTTTAPKWPDAQPSPTPQEPQGESEGRKFKSKYDHNPKNVIFSIPTLFLQPPHNTSEHSHETHHPPPQISIS